MTVQELSNAMNNASVVVLSRDGPSREPEYVASYFSDREPSFDSLLHAYGDAPVKDISRYQFCVSIVLGNLE